MATPPKGRTQALEKFNLPQVPVNEGGVDIDIKGIRVNYKVEIQGLGKLNIGAQLGAFALLVLALRTHPEVRAPLTRAARFL